MSDQRNIIGIEAPSDGDNVEYPDDKGKSQEEAKIAYNPVSSKGRKRSEIPVMDYDLSARGAELHDSLYPEDFKDTNASYNRIAHKIVNIAGDQLKSQNDSKIILKKKLSGFFRTFLIVQLIAILLLIAGQMTCKILWPSRECVSDKIIITFITSVFVETLSGIILMITYAFNSKDEIQITKILSDVIKNFKKDPPSDGEN